MVVFGVGLNCYWSNLMISARYRVIDNECKFLFWYNELFVYHAYGLVYLCFSLLEQQVKLVLIFQNIGKILEVETSVNLVRLPGIRQKISRIAGGRSTRRSKLPLLRTKKVC